LAARRIVRLGGWAAVLSAALLAGCAPKQAPPPPPVPVTPSPAAALEPEVYMALSSSNALFAIRASGLAKERASSATLRNFASKVVEDQTAIGAQLNFAGRRINLLPSSRLQPRYQEALDQLATASNFDATYRRQLATALGDCVHWHRSFERNGDSPTLRPVARFAASVCEANLEGLRGAQ
jgi:predicted outer membrane protein